MTPRKITNRVCIDGIEKHINVKHPIGSHGFIRIVDYMGGDEAIVQAARVSYGAGTKSVRSDTALIRYLLKHNHWSPFEMVQIKYHVKLPIFVARQWIRHRVGTSLNEYSARYSELSEDNYVPSFEEIGTSSSSNKQGTNAEGFSDEEKKLIQDNIAEVMEYSNKAYKDLIDKGLSREIARTVKATGGYTEWYWSTNLRSLIHFCRQRSDEHAQYAIRQYSDYLLHTVLADWCPATYGAVLEYVTGSVSFSKQQQDLLVTLIDQTEDMDIRKPDGMSNRDFEEVFEWYNEKVNKGK